MSHCLSLIIIVLSHSHQQKDRASLSFSRYASQGTDKSHAELYCMEEIQFSHSKGMRFLIRLQVFTSDSGMAPQAANCSAPVDTVESEMIDTLHKNEQ